ncbi:MAG: Stp1/IreP family PP2C-type Ser/Thr phosphatase [Clostridia bacterium]|nr:Stp1/IreP family PP2C-type Ser/Thr phosphatase [Clostridia bacterium]MBQ9848513.1 Stp1/IreP family PP2C-type Ser/Thr phosphatase [Clostridia bacterium]
MKYGGKSDIGMKRNCNQDSFAVFSKQDYFCAIVCDGMGGAKGGNIASGLAVKTFASVIKKAFSAKNADDFDEASVKALLVNAVNAANKAVYIKAMSDEELEGMGTTLVAVLNCLCGTFAVNIGDSRLYRQDENSLKQVSTDHSFVQYLIDKGEITPQEAVDHPNKNIILRALGVNEQVEGDYFRIDNFDRLLLCTDGLTNHVSDERIAEIMTGSYASKAPSLKARVERLIAEANEGGGLDNITAVIVGNE